MIKSIYCALLFCLILQDANGQLRYFQTADLEKETLQEFFSTQDAAEFSSRAMEFENYFQNDFLLYEEIEEKNISLVFNIVLGGEGDISDEQIIDQIRVLNEAFSGEVEMPEDDYYQDKQVDAEIEFCLFGLEAPYVNRINKPNTVFSDFNSVATDALGINPYSPTEFLNIWICDLDLISPDDRRSAGFAQLPLRDGLINGVVIDKDFFGRPEGNLEYNQGKTLVHLIGNYLGLKPLFGFSSCEDDGVDDTPIHSSELILCMEQKENDVTSSSCHGYERMMTRNFMSNVPDECAAMFTKGQKERMHAFLGEKGPLRNLVLEDEEKCLIKSNEGDGKERLAIEGIIVKQTEINLFPVPAHHQLQVQIIGELAANTQFEIRDISGKKTISGNANATFSIDLSSWESGVYFFILKTNDAPISKSFTVSH